jgi:hypothetical protein
VITCLTDDEMTMTLAPRTTALTPTCAKDFGGVSDRMHFIVKQGGGLQPGTARGSGCPTTVTATRPQWDDEGNLREAAHFASALVEDKGAEDKGAEDEDAEDGAATLRTSSTIDSRSFVPATGICDIRPADVMCLALFAGSEMNWDCGSPHA